MAGTPTNVEREVTSVDVIISKGDAKGAITYANPIFFKLSGYTQAELIGQPHALLRHPDMPKIIFKYMWDRIEAGNEVKAFVKNLCKDGGFYWVFSYVRIATNPDKSFRNYVSTRKAMSSNARVLIETLYKDLLAAEKNGGTDASLPILEAFLKDEGASLSTFNDAMQKIQNS